ncbi:MAG: hypothetical protein WC621_02120 [Patescibacteria group bacterium]
MEANTPRSPRTVSTIGGTLILALLALVGIVVIAALLPDQNLAPTPFIAVAREEWGKKIAGECQVGQKCTGPVLSAVDPEGDPVEFYFYDKTTKKEIIPPIKTESGNKVTPNFKFDQSGEKRVYVIVQDGSGHASAEYPMIINVR